MKGFKIHGKTHVGKVDIDYENGEYRSVSEPLIVDVGDAERFAGPYQAFTTIHVQTSKWNSKDRNSLNSDGYTSYN